MNESLSTRLSLFPPMITGFGIIHSIPFSTICQLLNCKLLLTVTLTTNQPSFIHPPCLPLPNNHYLFTSYLSLFANVRLVNQMMMIRRSTFAISFPHHLSLTLFHSFFLPHSSFRKHLLQRINLKEKRKKTR